jgi:hypothetical protein
MNEFSRTPISPFRQLARSITVADICSPFIATFRATDCVSEVFDEWAVVLCGERGMDPMEQIALVQEGDRVSGWVGFDMLAADKGMSECMDPITPDLILSADTSLIDAAGAFAKNSTPLFFVLRGNHFAGWLSYKDMHKPPLRLCLFAMLINLERMLLDAASFSPQEAIGTLSEGRLGKAREIYDIRNYGPDEEGKPYIAKLLECTTIADKLGMARKITKTRTSVPSLANSRQCSCVEKLRNEIAHPGMEEKSSFLVARDKLWPFIEWAETLESELGQFLEQTTDGITPWCPQ